MVGILTRLLSLLGSLSFLGLALLLLLAWIINPDFELYVNALKLLHELTALLADFLGWLADRLAEI